MKHHWKQITFGSVRDEDEVEDKQILSSAESTSQLAAVLEMLLELFTGRVQVRERAELTPFYFFKPRQTF